MSFYRFTYETYDELCDYFDCFQLPMNHEYITVCLAGGGKCYFKEHDIDTPTGFKCQNVGATRLRSAINIGYPVTVMTYRSAIEANNVDALELLYNHCKYKDYAHEFLQIALHEKHYHAVKWIIKHYNIDKMEHLYCSNLKLFKRLSSYGFIFDATCYKEIIKSGDMASIEYLHQLGVQWKDVIYPVTDIDGRQNIASSLNKKLVKSGNVPMLKWFLNHGLQLDGENHRYASTIEMIQFFVNNHIEPCPEMWFSSLNNIETLQWLFKQGYKINDQTFNLCVKLGDHQVKKWFIENKYELDIFKYLTDPIIKYLPISLIENIMSSIYNATKDNKYRLLNKQIYNETRYLFFDTYQNMDIDADSVLFYVGNTSNKFGYLLFGLDDINHNYSCNFIYYLKKNEQYYLSQVRLVLEKEYDGYINLSHPPNYHRTHTKKQATYHNGKIQINNYDLLTWYYLYKNRMPLDKKSYAKKLTLNKLNSVKNTTSFLSIYCYYNYMILNCYVFGITVQRRNISQLLKFRSLPRPLYDHKSLMNYMTNTLDQPCSDPLYEQYKLFMLKQIEILEKKVIDYINQL